MGSGQLHGVSLDPFLEGDKGICCSLFFISVNFCFSFVSNSFACITIPKNNGKTKNNWNKKLTATYTLFLLVWPFIFEDSLKYPLFSLAKKHYLRHKGGSFR